MKIKKYIYHITGILGMVFISLFIISLLKIFLVELRLFWILEGIVYLIGFVGLEFLNHEVNKN